MKYVELISNTGNIDTVAAIAEQHEVIDQRASAPGEDGLQAIRLLVADAGGPDPVHFQPSRAGYLKQQRTDQTNINPGLSSCKNGQTLT